MLSKEYWAAWSNAPLNQLISPLNNSKAKPKGRRCNRKNISRESVYSVYTVRNQQPKCLHNPLHFLQSVYINVNEAMSR
jgi:hypothetical protein